LETDGRYHVSGDIDGQSAAEKGILDERTAAPKS